jgi:hypothetical protein
MSLFFQVIKMAFPIKKMVLGFVLLALAVIIISIIQYQGWLFPANESPNPAIVTSPPATPVNNLDNNLLSGEQTAAQAENTLNNYDDSTAKIIMPDGNTESVWQDTDVTPIQPEKSDA